MNDTPPTPHTHQPTPKPSPEKRSAEGPDTTTNTIPSLYCRLRFTPLTDLLRGQLSARLDTEPHLAAAGLPAETTALIRRVVRRTGLWPREKTDVADELIAHFRDGHQAGTPDDDLLEAFGDERATARLIRRAKKRNRPLPWKAFVWSRRALVVMVALYALLAVRFFLGSPQVKVDYLAAVNADAQAVPEEDQAWPIYREAWIVAWTTADGDFDAPLYHNGNERIVHPGDPEWDQAQTFFDQQTDLLDALRLGGTKPGLGFSAALEDDFSPRDLQALNWTSDDEPAKNLDDVTTAERLAKESLMYTLLPHLGTMRLSARLLALDTDYAAEQGDAPRVVANLQAILGLARQTAETPFLINGLVGISLHIMACQKLQDVLAKHPDTLSDTQLQQLSHRFAAFSPRTLIRFEGKRMVMYDMLQRIYTDDGNGDGRITDEGVELLEYTNSVFPISEVADHPWSTLALKRANRLLVSPLVVASRQNTRKKFDDLLAQVEANYAQPMRAHPDDSIDYDVENWISREQMRYPVLLSILQGLTVVRRNAEHAEARRDGVLIALALELYRREHGGWPDTLEQLTPKFLPALPVDRITGGPLHYTLRDGRPVVYSVGCDRDDDGGVPHLDKKTGEPKPYRAAQWNPDVADDPVFAGDWVLIPAGSGDD